MSLSYAVRALVVIVLAATGSLVATPASAAEPWLKVSPDRGQYVAGHLMTYTGSLGVPGVRTAQVQTHMNRPGDSWMTMSGVSVRTRADGTFSFTLPAPSMRNLSRRVISGSLATPAFTFSAQIQDLVVAARSGTDHLVDNQVVSGRAFQIVVDTVPRLARRTEMTPPPAYPGRTLTLQQRSSTGAWVTLGTTTSDARGFGYFSRTVTTPGRVVYRVRQENVGGGHQIGWQPSFPTYVQVLDRDPGRAVTPPSWVSRLRNERSDGQPPVTVAHRRTAGQVYRWGPIASHYDWEQGQSLTSPPEGLVRRGGWVDTTLGSGRVALYNGAMVIDSQRSFTDGPGDFGTTRTQLSGNARTYGRWEANVRTWSTERNAKPYTVRVELVPADPKLAANDARTITLGVLSPHTRTLTIAANSPGGSQWRRTLTGLTINNYPNRLAVEVSRNHVSWFRNGAVIGTVRSEAAVSDVPMTLRITQVGAGEQEMNRTQTFMDWVRLQTLEHGRLTTNGTALKRYAR